MFRSFSGQTADEVWLNISRAICDDVRAQPSRIGPTREILHASISIEDPRQRWVASRTPAINPAFAIAEVFWILAGRNDAAYLNYFNSELPKFAGSDSTYYGAYGYRLAHHFGIDQLDRAFHILKNEPDSRQVVLQIWDCCSDLPYNDGKPRAPDIPCNVLSMLKLRSGKLDWMQIMRSNDVFGGLPYNIVQFTTLQEIMAGWLGVGVGTYNQVSDSLHAYESDLTLLKSAYASPAAVNKDYLALPREEFDRALAVFSRESNEIVRPDTPAEEVVRIAHEIRLPGSYKHLFLILSAEGLRRRRRVDLIPQIMAQCANACLVDLSGRWLSRFRAGNTSSVPAVI